MKTLVELQDQLSVARNFVECVFMACDDLPDEQGHPLAAVLDAAGRMLSGIYVDIEHLKLAESQGGSHDRG